MKKIENWQKMAHGQAEAECRRHAANNRRLQKSGLTRREFCQRQHIAVTTLDYWRRTQSRSTRLVEVEVAASEPAPGFTLSLSNGRRIESNWSFGEAELARLIRVAESA